MNSSMRTKAFKFVESIKLILSNVDYLKFIQCISQKNAFENDDHEVSIAIEISNIFYNYPNDRVDLMNTFCQFLSDEDSIINSFHLINEWNAIDGLMKLSEVVI